MVPIETPSFRPSLTATPTHFVAPSEAAGEGQGVSFQPPKHQSTSREANEFNYRYGSQFNTYAGESPSLAGRLRHCSINWEKITTDSWVLETVQGLRLNFVSPPVQTIFPQEASLSEEDHSLVTLEIQEMLQKGAIHMVPPSQTTPGYLSSLFLVPKKGGGQRPVVNLKPLNQFLPYEHFQMEGIHMVRDLLRKGDFMVKMVSKMHISQSPFVWHIKSL